MWTRFASTHCALQPAEAREIVEALAQSIAEESKEVERYAKEHHDAMHMLDALRMQWEAGVRDARAAL
jgi:hypothetical protein